MWPSSWNKCLGVSSYKLYFMGNQRFFLKSGVQSLAQAGYELANCPTNLVTTLVVVAKDLSLKLTHERASPYSMLSLHIRGYKIQIW